MESSKVRFTIKDLACEAIGIFPKEGLIGAGQIIYSGIRYNLAKDTGDSEKIGSAYKALHLELRLFKHNFLSRGKNHW